MEQLSPQSREKCLLATSVTGGAISHCIVAEAHRKSPDTAAAAAEAKYIY